MLKMSRQMPNLTWEAARHMFFPRICMHLNNLDGAMISTVRTPGQPEKGFKRHFKGNSSWPR